MDEIDRVQPRGILLLGRVAIETFIPGVGRLAEVVGQRVGNEVPYLYPLWHPAYVLRNGREERAEFDYLVARFVLTTKVLNERLPDSYGRQEDGVRLGDGSFTLGG